MVREPPLTHDGPWTSEVLVGDTPPKIGQTMTFVFDFGDWWEFDVTLERVDPGMALKQPQVLEVQGDPPAQYRVWDDEEWWISRVGSMATFVGGVDPIL